MVLRVIAIADDALLRDPLAAAVDALVDCEVVASAAPGDEDLSAAADVALWDLGPDLTGARAQLFRIGEVALPLLVLGPAGLGPAEAIAAGARGYLARATEGPRLRAALQAVAEDLQVLDPPSADEPRSEDGVEDLTHREMDVLQLLAEGLPNKEIARRLQISEHTVKFHVNTILAKLGARTRTEAVTRAARQGLIIL